MFEVSLADLHDVCEIFADLAQQLMTNASLASEQTVEGILVLSGLRRKHGEFLFKQFISWGFRQAVT